MKILIENLPNFESLAARARTDIAFNKRKLNANPTAYAEALPIKDLVGLLKQFDHYYHSEGEAQVSDVTYDAMVDVLKERAPKNAFLKKVGAAPVKGVRNKIKLPYWMPSLNKIKPFTDAFARWVKSGKVKEWVISDKLDGTSLLLVYSRSGDTKAYTRGNGAVGQDVSRLLTDLDVPQLKKDIVVRAEIMLPEDVFLRQFSKKSGGEFTTSRNMVSGLVNRLQSHTALKKMHAVAHELIVPAGKSPAQQFIILKNLGFKVVTHKVVNKLDQDALVKYLERRKKASAYGMDGLVITQNQPYSRTISDRPDYSIAFKHTTEESLKQFVVKSVEWSVTKTGKLAPRVEIAPAELGGVTVTYFSGFNAFFIEHGYPYKDRDKHTKAAPIGPGAVIQATRSGDVIPYITQVLKPARKPSLPDFAYRYGTNKVDIYISEPSAGHEQDMVVQRLIHFFSTMGMEGIKEGVIKKLLEAGHNTIPKILKLTEDDFLDLNGVQTTSAKKYVANIQKAMSTATFAQLGDALGIFGTGIGTRKLNELIKKFPNILNSDLVGKKLIAQLITVPTFSDITAKKVAEGLPKYRRFLRVTGITLTTPKKTVRKSLKMQGMKVLFSTVRDKDIEKYIEENGGEVQSSFNKETTHVVVLDQNSTSSKIEKARKAGIVVQTLRDFSRRYL